VKSRRPWRFPRGAGVAVVEHGAGQPDACLIAYVVPSGPGLDLPEVHAHARKALSNGCMPAAIMVIDEIPVNRRRGPQRHRAAGARAERPAPLPCPGHAPQEILCELFAQVLRVARCGVNSDFFDLGGRSVEAMMLAGRINADLNVRITMADLFRAPTVADLDCRLDQMASTRK